MHEHHTHEPVGGAPLNEEEDKAVCPVTHMEVSKKGAEAKGLVRTYQGEAHYFCCNGCTAQFDETPDKYTKNHEEKAGQ